MNEAAYVKRVMRPLVPIATGLDPVIRKLEGISTVVFDIYGTLLISAAGDIGMAGEDAAGCKGMSEVSALMEGAASGSGKEMAGDLVGFIEASLLAKRKGGVQFPEVDIRLIWKRIFEDRSMNFSDALIDSAALRYECSVNPVWEMPGALSVIRELKRRVKRLGIISNAQDYTHAVFAGVMGGEFVELGFDPTLMVFSYEQGEGKPSPALYQEMRERLSAESVDPESVLYVGNDMTKDVIPAAAIGFRTCLFAGDKRSLRLGDLSFAEATSIADVVVTEMNQIFDVLER